MADLASLQVALELQTAQFTEQMNKVNRELDGLNKKVNSVSDTFKKAGVALAGMVSVGTVIAIFKKTVDAMDEMRDSAQQLGITVEELSGLGFAAQQSGVGMDALNTGLRILNKNLADVEKGSTDAAKTLRAIGVDAGDTTSDALAKIADAFASIPNGVQKTAAAMAIFGKSGAQLIPLLNEGAAGIDKLKERAAELGIVLDGTAADNADKFNDAMGEIEAGIQGTVKSIVTGMLPAFAGIAEAFASTSGTGDEWKKFGEGLGEVLKFLAKVAIEVGGAFKDLGNSIAAIAAATAAFVSGNFAGAGEILRAWDEDSIKLAKSIQEAKDAIDGLGTELETTGNSAKKAATDTDLLKRLMAALGTETDKTNKKVKETAQALTPLQQVLVDLNKAGQQRLAALEQLQFIATLPADAFEQLGLSAQQFAEAQERIARTAGVWTTLDQAFSNIAKNKQAVVDMSAAWDTLVDKLSAGQISPEAFDEVVKELQRMAPAIDDASIATDKFDKSIEKLGEGITGAIATNANNAVNSLIDSFGEAEFSFSDMATSMLKDIAKLITQLLIMKPLMDSIKTQFGLSGFAKGGAFSSSTGLPFGIYSTPTVFGMPGGGPLKAYAKGGLLGEAGPEAILPLKRNAAGELGVAGAGVEVNVYNRADVEVSTKESQGADGQQVIDMYIDRRVNERFANGSMDKIMRNNYGVMRNAGA